MRWERAGAAGASAAVFALAALAGCGRDTGDGFGRGGTGRSMDRTGLQPPAYATEAQALDRAAREAVDAADEYAGDHNQDAMREMAEQKLTKLDEHIRAFSDRLNQPNVQAKPELRDAVRNLQEKSQALLAKIRTAKGMDENAWKNNLKPQVDQAVNDLEKAYDQFRKQFGRSAEAGHRQTVQPLEQSAKGVFDGAEDLLKKYTEPKRAEVERRLGPLEQQTQALRDRVQQAGGQAKPGLQEAVQNLTEKEAAFKQKLGEAKDAKVEDWNARLKAQLQQSLDDLKKAYDDAKGKLD
jgi:hypothetical protein